MKPEPFNPSEELAHDLQTNRAGHLIRSQKASVIMAAMGSLFALLCIGLLMLNVALAAETGLSVGGPITLIFFAFFVVSFAYMGLTAFFNARWFIPDMLSKNPVMTARGPLRVKHAERDRPEMPFSYIVGDYSFAPFVVPMEVPLEQGREYIVYYAAHSRIFLNIEPVE